MSIIPDVPPGPNTLDRPREAVDAAEALLRGTGQFMGNPQMPAVFGRLLWAAERLFAEVDRLNVELARCRMPSAAGVELCDRWMDKHGDDPEQWPHAVYRAYQNTLAELLSGGQA